MELSVQIEPTSELSVLEKSIFIARHINSAIDVLRPLVYQVWKDELWKEKFSSFGEYVESPEGLNKSQGYASKLKQVEQFRLDSGFSEKEVAGVDYESIYLALKSGGTPQEILAKAKTLTRAELRISIVENNFGESHEHKLGTQRWGKCNDCESFVLCVE